LRESLLLVFGLDDISEIDVDASLVKDIRADSLDFVEIVYLIEREFGVVLKTGDLLVASTGKNLEECFSGGKLSAESAEALNREVPDAHGRFFGGMSRADLLATLSVRDLAKLIERRLSERDNQEVGPC